ncbi:MAG: threonine/serine exporter family protein, partial [Paracoccus sp. (in: a-proteobacteria)]|nr:threonine/serine exporter family protein [Paracoccus sp. (in: a-proteobacteria)]
AAACGLACLIAGALLEPLARRRAVPFSAAGFASVVALIPGLYVFRATSGLVGLVSAPPETAPAILTTAAQDGATAITMMAAMVVGLFVPERIASLLEAGRR